MKSQKCSWLIVLFLWLTPIVLSAQPYINKPLQHRFAQTYIGLNTQVIPSSGKLVAGSESGVFPFQAFPRFSIGGLHFWGRLDFTSNFNIGQFTQDSYLDDQLIQFNSGGDIAIRYFPWQIIEGILRPYVGYSVNMMVLGIGEGQRFRKDIFLSHSIVSGFVFSKFGWQFNADFMYLPSNEYDFYSSEIQKETFQLPHYYLSFGLVKYFDVTLKEEKPKLSGLTKKLEKKLLSENKLNSFSFSFAPSSSFFVASPSFSGDEQSLPSHKATFNWEFAMGYLFHKQNIHVGLTYRTVESQVMSYSLDHIVRREAWSLEAFKFLMDYNGFVPFVGISLSSEEWRTGLFKNDTQEGKTNVTQILSPGLIFGWDILASPLETWVLRTNLRYYPFQKINDFGDRKSRVDQFEFNLIQVVVYPNRWFHINKAKKKSNYYS